MLGIIIIGLTVVSSFANAPYDEPQPNKEPSVVRAVAAAYPTVALVARVSGSVIVELKINAKGDVTSADAISGHKLLRKTAEVAARRWVFAPANKMDKARKARLTFEFILMPGDASYADLLPVFVPPHRVEVRDMPGRIVAYD